MCKFSVAGHGRPTGQQEAAAARWMDRRECWNSYVDLITVFCYCAQAHLELSAKQADSSLEKNVTPYPVILKYWIFLVDSIFKNY